MARNLNNALDTAYFAQAGLKSVTEQYRHLRQSFMNRCMRTRLSSGVRGGGETAHRR